MYKPSIYKGEHIAKFSVCSVPAETSTYGPRVGVGAGHAGSWHSAGGTHSGAMRLLCSLQLFPNWLLLYLSGPQFFHLSNGIEINKNKRLLSVS